MSTVFKLEGLGLCEHCGALVSIEELPVDSSDPQLTCPGCERELGHLSFGFDKPDGDRVRWVGSNGAWTTIKPTRDFDLPSGIYVKTPSGHLT